MAVRTKAEIERFQREANVWTEKYLLDVGKLKVDGERGHATNRRINTIKWYLGYGDNRNAAITEEFVRRMRHPKDPEFFPKDGKMIEVGEARRRKQKKLARESRGPTDGVVMFDGKPCAGWIADHLGTVRKEGRWTGWLVSGFRTPEYSEHLCYNMCGKPSCPGKCAGRSTNHAKYRNPEGAVDLSDYVRFGQECQRLGIPLHNALGPADPVHYSTSGR